jgi:hypothetical protein
MQKHQITNRADYFAMRALSNSDLTELAKKEEGKFVIKTQQEWLDEGNILDALITYPADIDSSHPFYPVALKMRDKFLADPFCQRMYELAGKQIAYTNLVGWAWKVGEELYTGETYSKCLYDFDFNERMSADLKKTSAKTYNEFLRHVDLFDYDRAAVHYMEVGAKDMHSLIGLSKTRIQAPFLVHVKRGDPIYMRGLAKWKRLMWLYEMTK